MFFENIFQMFQMLSQNNKWPLNKKNDNNNKQNT